ncbi:unnamed protein product, partial [Larinioides sclopetarius]
MGTILHPCNAKVPVMAPGLAGRGDQIPHYHQQQFVQG